MIHVEIATKFGSLFGAYTGGAYISLSFGVTDKPIEVINVYDYEKSEPTIPENTEAVTREMESWLTTQDDYNLQQFFFRQALN